MLDGLHRKLLLRHDLQTIRHALLSEYSAATTSPAQQETAVCQILKY